MKSINWENRSADQVELWNHAQALIAWNTLTPLYYQGVIAGSEFLTYDVNKLYICLDFKAARPPALLADLASITVYKIGNIVSHTFEWNQPAWDVTAAGMRYINNDIVRHNFYFVRIVAAQYETMMFNGYKLTV